MVIEYSCKDIIQKRMDRLTNTEKKIAVYILKNYERVLENNISELAENVGVSDASIVRFCKNIGYKGYQDFRINAAKYILPKEKHFNPILEKNDSVETIYNKIFNSDISVLEKTLFELDIEILNKTADVIINADKIILFGSGASLLVAKDALHKLIKIGIMVYVYEDVDLQLMSSSLLSKNDVAIGVSHSGSNRNVIKCIKNAKYNGAFSIAIVGRDKSPLSKISDISIHTAYEKNIFQSESVSTRIAQLALIDAIVAVIAFKNYEFSYNSIQKTRMATSDNKL